ncbi:unnamed protein product [Peronospora destructor]|uniref:WRKY19-like zinc finger domain-containing protein n=1 Tax=Peronospora destructor TaxID=86335 RepID=A0AAV0TJ24_9STRA|nr:unnamed protein product [Peronospora destructor]
MNIYHQSLLEGLNPSTPDEIPNSSEILALLHLVIPSDDASNDMTLINSYNPIEDPFMPQLSDVSLPMTTPFHDAASSAGLTELIISHNVQVLTEPLFHPAQSWIETPSFVGPAFSFEVPQPDYIDAHKLIELFEDTDSLQDKSKQKNRQQQSMWKKPKGKCEVAGCNTKMQSKGKCIRHGGGRRCVVEGCTRGAQTMHRCKRHGGGARCKVEGCGTSSQGGGLCRAHGGGKLCTAPGCKKGAQRQGKCATHSSQKCRIDACSSVARCRGLCSRHKRQKLHM